MQVFVSCPKGMQYALESELRDIGYSNLKPVLAGVEAEADLSLVYKTLLWSRLANRVFVELAKGKIEKGDDVRKVADTIDWLSHFTPNASFLVNFLGTNKVINNSNFGALKIKDAIVDQFREETGSRPSINKENPDVRVSARLSKGVLTVSLDLAGDSLHKRGYRIEKGPAPLKENLAAALLQLSGWPKDFPSDAAFVDPMCGSGTLCIEAAMMALDMAPNLRREKWGFDSWLRHDPKLWAEAITEAEDRYELASKDYQRKIVGFDMDARVTGVAWSNIDRAGLKDFVHVEKKELSKFSLPETLKNGLILTNPPYGERLGEVEALEALYVELGNQFDVWCKGWKAGLFTGNGALGKRIGWKSYKQYKLLNGAIESMLILIDLEAENRIKRAWVSPEELVQNASHWQVFNEERAEMLKNRLAKNARKLKGWRKQKGVTCYRLYDADMPEFSFALDVYESESGDEYLYVQEYAPPKLVDVKSSSERLSEALCTIRSYFDSTPEQMFLKQRQVQKGVAQYERSQRRGLNFVARENEARFEINLGEYLDTGLFLDHRAVRSWIKSHSKNKRVLNLFAYTGSISVMAGLGGASAIDTIDMSHTYLDWAKRNFSLNGLKGRQFSFIREDVVKWLDLASSSAGVTQYDLIFIDPPSFSNSKKMEGVFDVQRDHLRIIKQAMKLLSEDGVLIFSNNLRSFKLDGALESVYQVEDKKQFSIDRDFERNQKIHHCWFIRQRSNP
jgi:23S rRNA (guanine2445-N2)-methyltransferase / 23S rRNA (guanine2069-N7)-methyltransferase